MRNLASAIGCALFAGWVLAACTTPLPEEALERRLRLVGTSVLGPRASFTTVPIQADSNLMAWTLIADARTNGPSNEARWLQRKLSAGAQGPAQLVVGGPFPGLTRQVLLDAFGLNEDRSLPGLTLVFVGDEASAADVRSAAQRVGARFHQRALP